MFTKKITKKLWLLWFSIILAMALITTVYPLKNASDELKIAIVSSIGFTIFLGWYLIVNQIFSYMGPITLKPYAGKYRKSLFAKHLLRFIMTKESYAELMSAD
jgi:hypothetical protein